MPRLLIIISINIIVAEQALQSFANFCKFSAKVYKILQVFGAFILFYFTCAISLAK